LGIIPRGTANALAVCLYGKPMRLDPIGTGCSYVVAGNTRVMDVAEVDGKHMFLLSGVGIEAGMVERADREWKRKWGPLAYIVGAMAQLGNQEPFHAELEVDGEKHAYDTASVVVANAAPISSVFAQGGGAPDFEDGLLDVTVLIGNEEGKLPVDFETMLALLDSEARASEAFSGIRHFQGKQIKIRTVPSQKMVLDGELHDAKDGFVFQVKPAALKVFAAMPESEKEAIKTMAASSIQVVNASKTDAARD
jgi:diacylglycerol kinase family enzyme